MAKTRIWIQKMVQWPSGKTVYFVMTLIGFLNFLICPGFVSEVDVKRTSMKQESPSSSSMLPETKTVVKSAVEKRPRTKRSPPSSPSVKVKKRPATAAALSSKELTNDDNNQYSPLELEMETKMSDYFQMNCDLCMHRFSSWSDARLHYLDRHNVLKPFLRCCNRKYFLRSRIIEHIIWHVDPSSFWYEPFVADAMQSYLFVGCLVAFLLNTVFFHL